MKKISFVLGCVLLCAPLFALAADETPATQATDPATQTSDSTATTPSGSAFQFQRQGIFDCNQSGSYAMSVGALSAIGGAYVPVADAAVELNTGTLVYKECVLREVVDKEREAALAAFFKQLYNSIQSGRGGNALYVQKQPSVEVVLNATDPAFLALLKDGTLQNISDAFRSIVIRTLAQTYETETRSPEKELKCPIQNLPALLAGQRGSFNWIDFQKQSDRSCYALGVSGVSQALSSSRLSQANNDLYQQWLWGNGYYPRTDGAADPRQQVTLTPSSVVGQSFQQILSSPVRQLENANDIGQMIGALYAGVTSQVVGDNRGLAGLAQSAGNQLSYLDQVAKESSQGLQSAAVNAALQILGGAQQIESAYYQAVNAIGASLTQAKLQLQSAENQCWTSIVSKVCATALTADNTCTAVAPACTTDPNNPQQQQTCPTAPKLKVATSTAFSKAVIDSQITPLVSAAAANIDASKSALQIISNLIQGVANTGSLDAQRVALQQLDTLVAQKKLHTQTELANVVQQQSSVANSMGDLLQRTAQIWSGTGTDGTANVQWDGTVNPGNGWCNVNNSATIASWIQTWKQ